MSNVRDQAPSALYRAQDITVGGPVRSVGHNDTKVLVRILNHDGTVANSVSEVKQRRPWKESEQGTSCATNRMKALIVWYTNPLKERKSS